MIKLVKKHHFVLLVFLFLTLVFILPQLSIHSPSLIDDGSDLFKAASNNYFELFKKETFFDSRIKTALIIYRKIAFDLFHFDLSYHFLLQSIFLWATTASTYFLLKKAKAPTWLSLATSLIIFVLPSTVANYYRLGTSEHFQFMLVLFGLINIKKRLQSLVLFTTACFFKENSVFFLTLPIFYSLTHKYFDRKLLVQISVFIAYCSLLVYKIFYLQNAYTHQSTISWQNLRIAISISSWTFAILLISVSFVIYKAWQKQKIINLHVYYTFFISIFTFFIWPMNQIYYHFPSQGLAIICIAFIFHYFYQQSEYKKIIISLFASLYCIFLIKQLGLAIETGTNLHKQHLADSALSKFIMENNWAGYHIYSNINDFEAVHKINMYFNEWQPENNRPDFQPNIEKWLATDFTNVEELNLQSKRAEKDFFEDLSENKLLISRLQNQQINNPNTLIVCGNSFLIRNYCKYLITFGK